MPPHAYTACLQSAAIPYRLTDTGMEVLMVTSRGGSRWLFPKGGIGKGLTPAQSAAREAYEEAGVIGDLHPRSLGRYHFRKRDMPTRIEPCEVEVFLLHVHKQLRRWPEKGLRRQRWVEVAEAALMVEEGGLVDILLRLAQKDVAQG